MVNRSTRKVSELGAGGSNAGLSILIRVTDDGISVGYVEIVANKGGAKRRVEVVQKYGPKLGTSVSFGAAQQRDAICILCFRAGEPLHPTGNDVLRPVDRGLRTVALNHQYVSIGENVKRARMLKAGGQCVDLQSLRHRGIFSLFPSDGFCNPYRRHEVLLQRGQHGIGADLSRRVAGAIVTTGEPQASDSEKQDGETFRV